MYKSTPPITFYWTVPLILDHSYFIGIEDNKVKNCWYKSVRILEVLKLLFQQFLNLSSSQRNMSGPILGDLSINRWSGVYSEMDDVLNTNTCTFYGLFNCRKSIDRRKCNWWRMVYIFDTFPDRLASDEPRILTPPVRALAADDDWDPMRLLRNKFHFCTQQHPELPRQSVSR